MTSAIDRLDAAGKAATKGPWREGTANVWHDATRTVVADTGAPFTLHLDRLTRLQTWDNAAFIALARNSWDAIIEALHAATDVNRFAGNPERKVSFDLACFGLDKALAALESAVDGGGG